MNGQLIAFEGANGSGKTTFSRMLCDHIAASGNECHWFSNPGSEEDSLGRFVYELQKDVLAGRRSLTPDSVQLLHVAAHIHQYNTRIFPIIQSGGIVILDRFWWSVVVHGTKTNCRPGSLNLMIELENQHWSHQPDLVLLVESDQPHDEELNDSWLELKHLYQTTAATHSSIPCKVISNTGDVEGVFINQVLPAVSSILKHKL